MIPARISFALVLFLFFLRAVMAALLPLSADEAYYWLWSKHLAAGYFDHPPMIAWAIRAGTALFGDTPFGVRFAGVLLSLPATWFVWQTAALVLKDEQRAAMGALFFNLTLMASIELLAATPDMPSLVTSAGFVYFLARARQDDRGIFWLGVGIAAGLGLLSKYSALFLGLGTAIWLLLDPKGRKCLASPWPWFGAAFALAIFLPNLLWQSQHGWETFAYQFGRMGTGHWAPRYELDLLGSQFALATPLIFAAMACGLWSATRAFRSDREPEQREGLPARPLNNSRFFLAVLVWTGLAYFIEHALRDRVQGNWPCFLYPALAVLAASANMPRWLKPAAVALAAAMLLAVYAQAAFQLVPLKKDPLARVLGRDFAPVRQFAGEIARRGAVSAILTTDYETTAWLRFYEPGVAVVQVNEPWRYADAPAPDARLLSGRLVYLTVLRRDQHQQLAQDFGYVGFPTQAQTPSENYMLYPVGNPRHFGIGKMP